MKLSEFHFEVLGQFIALQILTGWEAHSFENVVSIGREPVIEPDYKVPP
jgi:hypothetical protein